MAASDIGANSSNYSGDSNLGGGSLGFGKLDVSPIMELAKYTMLYNRAEYDQRQKDAEAAADEISKLTSYDLTSSIPKDAKLLQEKYDALIKYANEHPEATDYKNKEAWMKYKTMRNDLDNDLKMAKSRSLMNMVRMEQVSNEKDVDLKNIMKQELEDDINKTDIRTPLQHSHQYGDYSIKLPPSPDLTFDVVKTGPNATVIRDFKVFNITRARANGDVFALGLDQIQDDPNTPEGKRAILSKKRNFWVQGSEAFNSIIKVSQTKDEDGLDAYHTKLTDDKGNVTYKLKESKLPGLVKNLVNLAKETNKYLSETKADIQAGVYKDKFENKISFGDGAMREIDYDKINYEDGISPEELAVIAQYAHSL